MGAMTAEAFHSSAGGFGKPMKAVFTVDCDFCCGNVTVTVEEVVDDGV